jgi:hypothetical protein
VQPISISLRGPRYEAMLLMGAADWVRSELGRWTVDGSGTRLSLGDCGEESLGEVFQGICLDLG